jgi:seryl-tRNA synthetase
MLDIKFIKENQEAVRQAIKLKNVHLDLDDLIKCDQTVSDLKRKIELQLTARKSNAKKTSQATVEEKESLILKGREIGHEIELLKSALIDIEKQFKDYLLLVPNIPSADAPIGTNENDNVEVKKWKDPKEFNFPPLNHVDLLQKNNWAELQRITNVCGSRTYALKNEMVLLEMALIQFALEKAQSNHFQLLTLPSLVRESALYGTGHFPEGRDQAYFLPADNLYLAGTAEAPINSLHSGEILNEKDLPLLYAGFSPCFRREAGSAGRDVKGLIRVHQFYKVELFVICKNDHEESLHWLQKLLSISEDILQSLELPYRVIECCTGDMGVGKFKMFDIESWVPSESKYRETHSCSSLLDWQARRSNVRYRTANGNVEFCHTLNNTAIATPRILVPFLENHQQENGEIYIPLALREFVGNASYLAGSKA